MAIIIPSKNIYNKQNPKVRDNVIERIEVDAIEINQKAVYETNAYEEAKEYLLEQQNDIRNWRDDDFLGKEVDTLGVYAFVASNVISKDYYNLIPELIVPKSIGNSSIRKIRSLSYSIVGVKKTYNCTGSYTAQPNYYTSGYFHEDFIIGDQIEENEINSDIYESSLENTINGSLTDTRGMSATAKIEPKDWSEIPKQYVETYNAYIFRDIKVLAKREVLKLKAEGDTAGLRGQSSKWDAVGTYIEYIPDNIILNINGDIVTIETKDKTVYINGETQKKVYSVDGNELMQTSNCIINPLYIKLKEGTDYTVEFYSRNGVDYADIFLRDYVNYIGKKVLVRTYEQLDDLYYGTVIKEIVSPTVIVDNGGYYLSKVEVFLVDNFLVDDNAINFSFVKIQKDYEKGKETATIRCPISDYYDFDSGEKIISIDKSTGNMSFKMYDEVIPMVYTSEGKDKPMSVYKDGTPKVFRVLGTKIYYDGAVWQELSLQEI